MRILIIAPGSRGDVEPYLALAQGLQAAGHAVRFLTHENFASLVTSYGVDFRPIPGNAQDIAQGSEMRDSIGKGNFLAHMAQMAKDAETTAVHAVEAGLDACEGVELLIAGIAGLFVSLALAEKLGLPVVQAYYVPFTPTRQYPSALLPSVPAALGGSLNRVSYYMTRQMIWQGFRSADRVIRGQVLGLAPAPFLGPYNSRSLRGLPVLYCFSPAVIPPAPDWDDKTHVTGYWFLDPPAGWSPAPELSAFLQAGPPPVFVGFGSMPDRDPHAATQIVLEAVSLAGQRAILGAGWGGLRPTDLPESVLMVDSVPFSWLFSRVSAVVHHGGAGTTAWGLRAGVPAVIVPYFADQPFWGRRVAATGCGAAAHPTQETDGRRAGGSHTHCCKRRSHAPASSRARRQDPGRGWRRRSRRSRQSYR